MVYETNSDNTARFALGDLGSKNLVFFGVNPSVATDSVFDSTIRKVKHYSHSHGFDGWLMLNLYPQRATNPQELHENVNLGFYEENKAQISKALQNMSSYTLCAAWGNLIQKRKYLFTALECIVPIGGDCQWHSIGPLTKEGHPRHPLYVSTSTLLHSFDVQAYISTEI